MLGKRATRSGVLVSLLVGVLLLLALAPSSARAAWKSIEARIIDPGGTGFVPLLNVRVANHAVNDAAAVTAVEFSDDGASWYSIPYTGRTQDWVLTGDSGHKMLSVRFVTADGTVSPVVGAGITVDTGGPGTVALGRVRAAAGLRARFRYTVSDDISPRVDARLVVRGGGVRRCLTLGVVTTGTHVARVALGVPRGTYRWSIVATDLAGWRQERQVSQTLVVN